MAISPAELPPVPQVIDQESLPAVEQSWLDEKNSTRISRELNVDYSQYMQTAWKVANDMYPNDPDKREAFLNGTELSLRLERQRKAATELTALLFDSTETDLPTVA